MKHEFTASLKKKFKQEILADSGENRIDQNQILYLHLIV